MDAGVAIGAAHVLVPPDKHHEAGLSLAGGRRCSVLVEKPLASSRAGCDCSWIAAAHSSGGVLGVNQNFVFHPAFVRLREAVAVGAFGPARFVDCIYSVPLRQLAARQFGHWMFNEPGNLLLEQAVHPLSQILALAGPMKQVRALAGPPSGDRPRNRALPERHGQPDWRFPAGPAPLRGGPGVSFLAGDRRLRRRDLGRGHPRRTGSTPTAAPAGWNPWTRCCRARGRPGPSSGKRSATALGYGLSTLRLRPRSDGFYRSMQGSIGSVHAALRNGVAPEMDGAFGAALVSACELIGQEAFGDAAQRPRPLQLRRARHAVRSDFAVLGGTGFIGTQTVRRLLRDGARISVMARSVGNLPGAFHDERVALHQGDVRDAAAVGVAIAGAGAVINLAHGGGGASFEQVRAAMVGGAETVASACLHAGVRRLVHVGSIASLYLGPQAELVTGKTPSDPRPEVRADYARAKAICEARLLEMHAQEGLPVCLLRPGLVVGEGTSPFPHRPRPVQ